MAVTKIGHQNSKRHMKNAIEYICRPDKTGGGRYIGYQNCSSPYEDFLMTKKIMAQMRHRKDVMEGRQGYHIMISFSDADQNKITSEMAMQIIADFAQKYIPEYEAVFSVHEDTGHKHCHLIWNSVNAVTGKKYHYQDGDWAKNIQPIVNELTKEYGLDTINVEDWPETENLDYTTWQKKQNSEPIWGDYERYDIDQAIAYVRQNDGDYEDFINMLRKMGYEITRNGKVLTLKHPGRKKGIRTHQLGHGYHVEEIKARLTGKEMEELQEAEKQGSSIVYPAVVPVPVVSVKKNLQQNRKLQIYTIVRCRHGIKLYKARRAYYPCIASRRPAYGILDIRRISWQNRKYSMDLNRIAGDYAWMVKNDVRSIDQAQNMCSQIVTQKRRAYAQKKKLTAAKKKLLEERDQLTIQLSASANQEEQNRVIVRIREIDTQVSGIDMIEMPDLRKTIAALREEEKRAERVREEILQEQNKKLEENKIDGRTARK